MIQQIFIQFELIPLEQVQINPKGDTVAVIPANSPLTGFLRNLWLLVSFLYLARYWTKSGQTLGMHVWKVKTISAINDNATNLNWQQAALRYIFSAFGLGLLWIPFNKEHLALQDILSKTKLVRVT